MGNMTSSSTISEFKCRDRSELFDLTDENGFTFQAELIVPEEVLANILSFLPASDLFNYRTVCKGWCNVIDSQVWRIKNKRDGVPVPYIEQHYWQVSYLLHSRLHLFGKNLLKNNCGQDGLRHWKIIGNGGDRWRVEKPPSGSDGGPECEEFLAHNSCFVTSFSSCTKEQIIDLEELGLHSRFMDLVKPTIHISEWYSGRFDCLSIYELFVTLLNKNRSVLDNTSVLKKVGSADSWDWQKISHEFKNYPTGVKFIKFYHGGKDRQFWKGHYGSKMTGGCVMLKLPAADTEAEVLDQDQEEDVL